MATTLLTSGITMGSSTLSPTGTAPSYTCRAWVNFNGQGTVAIREDGNVSSITDNGTGNYTVNFTNAMPDNNYCYSISAWRPVTFSAHTDGPPASGSYSTYFTTSSIRMAFLGTSSFNSFDPVAMACAIFR